jgi:hypothetical protein
MKLQQPQIRKRRKPQQETEQTLLVKLLQQPQPEADGAAGSEAGACSRADQAAALEASMFGPVFEAGVQIGDCLVGVDGERTGPGSAFTSAEVCCGTTTTIPQLIFCYSWFRSLDCCGSRGNPLGTLPLKCPPKHRRMGQGRR